MSPLSSYDSTSVSEFKAKKRWVLVVAVFGAAVLAFGLTINGFNLCEKSPVFAKDLGASTFAPVGIIDFLSQISFGESLEWNPVTVFVALWLFYSLLAITIISYYMREKKQI
ncbi:MAG: hypothetical protein IPP71_15675 [Bacteroidetes bacterium]|nr:hypothetical protein [Bacteroidota bacterium]